MIAGTWTRASSTNKADSQRAPYPVSARSCRVAPAKTPSLGRERLPGLVSAG